MATPTNLTPLTGMLWSDPSGGTSLNVPDPSWNGYADPWQRDIGQFLGYVPGDMPDNMGRASGDYGAQAMGIPFAPTQEQLAAGPVATFYQLLSTYGFRPVEQLARAGWFDGFPNMTQAEREHIFYTQQRMGQELGEISEDFWANYGALVPFAMAAGGAAAAGGEAAGAGGTAAGAEGAAGAAVSGGTESAALLGGDAAAAGAADTLATGTLMPAAQPLSTAELTTMGLTETAPGVWSAAGPAAAGGTVAAGSAAGGATEVMPQSGGAPGTGGSGTVNIPGVGDVPISTLGTIASTLLGVYGANRQADAYGDMAAAEDARIREMMGYGAPYRTALSELYADPDAFLQSDRVQIPVQMGTDALARSLSMSQGNPALSGTAMHELQNYASNQLFSRYGEEADRLAGFGGLTQYAGGAARGPDLGPATNAINAQGGVYNIIGAGIADATRPQRTRQTYLV